MTKRLTIALIALVALVLVAVLPVSATYYDINNTVVGMGATLYAGEQQLNLTPLRITMLPPTTATLHKLDGGHHQLTQYFKPVRSCYPEQYPRWCLFILCSTLVICGNVWF